MNYGWNVILRHDPSFNGMQMWLVKMNSDNSREIVHPIDLTITHELKPELILPEPTIRFAGHDAQQFLQGLADGLVEAGFRPDVLKSQDKEIKAIGYHLEDMRALVFKKK